MLSFPFITLSLILNTAELDSPAMVSVLEVMTREEIKVELFFGLDLSCIGQIFILFAGLEVFCCL
jgi:hypothetical protein